MNKSSELLNRYQRLRRELEAAYTAARWDSSRIDRIADEIVSTELQLSRYAVDTAVLSQDRSSCASA